MRRRLICLSLLAGILVPADYAAAAAPTPPTRWGGIGVRLVVPTGSRDDPHANSWIVERFAPGTSVRRRVEIINNTASTQDVAVYPAAAGLRQGGFRFAPGENRNELSGWTSMSRDVLGFGLVAVACFALLLSRPGALLRRKIDPNVLGPTAVWGQRGAKNGVK